MSAPTQNKQWLTKQDGLDNLYQFTSPSLPTPGEGEVLVKINAVSLNYRDTEVCMGLYNHHSTTGSNSHPVIVPCADAAGTVVASSSTLWSPGDHVISIFNQSHLTGQVKAKDMKSGLGSPLEGVLQEYRVFKGESLVKKPDSLTDVEACTLPIAGVTAWMGLNGMRPLGQPGGKGETILIQGTGGVSISGLLLAKRVVLRLVRESANDNVVIITSSSDKKLEQARELGADYTINYRTTPDWDVEVMKITNGEGVDIIFECGGAKTLRKSFSCIAFGGLIDSIGYLSGKQDPEEGMNVNVLALMRNVTLKGILNGPKDRFEEMLQFWEKEKIKPVVDKVFEFDQGKEAIKYLFEGGHFGKVVVKVSE